MVLTGSFCVCPSPVAPLSECQRLFTSFQTAVETNGLLIQTVMQAILHGNAGFGKTSLIKSLLGLKSNENEKSTGVMKEPARIELSAVCVEGSDSSLQWKHIEDLQEETALLVRNVNSEQISSYLTPGRHMLRMQEVEEFEGEAIDDDTIPPPGMLQFKKYIRR